MQRFNQGKWEFDMILATYPVVLADHKVIADCTDEANALLMAESPTMYHLLERVLDVLSKTSKNMEICREIKACLRRADGVEYYK